MVMEWEVMGLVAWGPQERFVSQCAYVLYADKCIGIPNPGIFTPSFHCPSFCSSRIPCHSIHFTGSTDRVHILGHPFILFRHGRGGRSARLSQNVSGSGAGGFFDFEARTKDFILAQREKSPDWSMGRRMGSDWFLWSAAKWSRWPSKYQAVDYLLAVCFRTPILDVTTCEGACRPSNQSTIYSCT